MSLLKRIKNLWRLSGYEFEISRDTKRVIITDKAEVAQFIEPVSFKEKFSKAKTVDDLLE